MKKSDDEEPGLRHTLFEIRIRRDSPVSTTTAVTARIPCATATQMVHNLVLRRVHKDGSYKWFTRWFTKMVHTDGSHRKTAA